MVGLGQTWLTGGLGCLLTVLALQAPMAGEPFRNRDESPMERVREQIHEQYWQRKEQRRRLERRCQRERAELRAGQRDRPSGVCRQGVAPSGGEARTPSQ
ncbi:MAG: hypothetical protein R3175_07265 [Marinobacter sp.]|uniref:hypothetical protein n=1 Tax=Marinobacter sp. TaxID=50741 RepID=UPI00299E1971|nr:hypothetical protein [Marinobacter sp.]MDX1755840.1 hypothetical protein [Marinobacter sp.]